MKIVLISAFPNWQHAFDNGNLKPKQPVKWIVGALITHRNINKDLLEAVFL
jgi:hypothetical protein